MISTPHTYAEWVGVIDDLKNKTDDEGVLEAMMSGSLDWQAGVAERFSQKLIDAVNHRMNMISDRFQKEMGRSNGQEGAIVQALLMIRKEMTFLVKVMNIPVIPEDERQHYTKLVREQADKMQESLEDSAKQDRSGKMLSIVRNHKVNTI